MGAGKMVADVLPGTMPIVLTDWYRWLRYPQERQLRAVRRRLRQQLGIRGEVLGGPFKGMRCLSHAFFGALIPKMLGIYEKELGPAVENAVALGIDCVINVGAAEGYYAVGLALRIPSARIVCFEMSKPARAMVRKMARLNGVESRIEILGACSPENLGPAMSRAKYPLVVCDVEGYEDVLLDPEKVPALARAAILVELHDAPRYAPGCTERIKKRFEKTHLIEHILSTPRTAGDIPAGVTLSRDEFAAATGEGRDSADWLYMKPIAAGRA